MAARKPTPTAGDNARVVICTSSHRAAHQTPLESGADPQISRVDAARECASSIRPDFRGKAAAVTTAVLVPFLLLPHGMVCIRVHPPGQQPGRSIRIGEVD